MNLFIVLFFSILSIFIGKPAENTGVYLEKGGQLIAFQVTGEKGKVSFKHLDEGSYKLLLVFPQQEGKYIKEKPRHETMTKATYNPKNKTYYYQGTEGFFAIKFRNISRIRSENFSAIFREELDEEDKFNAIAEFGIHNSGGSIGLSVEAITAAKFKKAADKIGQDISTQSIRGIK
ncbi:hypothetical protein SAMN05444285_102137 [Draconibacterium orientale]|uniref:Uncharacterized protein n=1 Tax=Draconibacterium orientale TaxID=1168034 RepID=X5E305_9BACT|nr:hypothetical protein [Draconibacterium orientale]AHW61815.1 hypothetical protein FH5T_08760 [Draconibacterium orientale]SES80731.1 hypothetical protein SAMN05444285_102137 [Draconibacterium orientale]